MSQGEDDYDEEALQCLTLTIAGKIGGGALKIESFFSLACIYRVPENLRKLKESAYTPRLIAIGPLHRNDEHLQTPLQHIKMSYTNYLLSRLTPGMEDLQELAKQTKLRVLQKCLAEMKTSLDDAKKRYAAEVTLDEEMMLVDGCFILEFLYRSQHGTSEGPNTDPIFGNTLTLYDVKNDLVLLENQIPFFVLEKLFHLTVRRLNNNKNWSLTYYVRQCYGNKMSPIRNSNNSSSSSARTWYSSPSDCFLRVFGKKTENPTTKEEEEDRNAKYFHILHNIHAGYLPLKVQTTQNASISEGLMPSASELKYAGVMFVPDESGNNLFKFKFSEPKGLLWWCLRARFVIPPLAIYYDTELYLRNLIAFEQFCPTVSKNVTSFEINF